MILVACNAVGLYTNILSLDISLVELAAWNNTVQIAGISSKDFALKSITNLLAIHTETLDLEKNGVGTTGDILRKVLSQNVCDSLRHLDSSQDSFANCEEAMAGVANRPLTRFLPLYARLAEQFVVDWSQRQSYEDKAALLRDPHYASMLSYQIFNSLGMADEIYYTIMMPVVTRLLEELDAIRPAVDLVAIICALFVILMLPVSINSAYFSIQTVLKDFWQMVHLIPLRLIDSSTRLKQKLKQFHKEKNFGKLP